MNFNMDFDTASVEITCPDTRIGFIGLRENPFSGKLDLSQEQEMAPQQAGHVNAHRQTSLRYRRNVNDHKVKNTEHIKLT